MDSHKTIEDVQRALYRLKELLQHADCVKNLEISYTFSIQNDYASQSFPNSADAGVYIFTDCDDHVLYIGKASGLGQRIGQGYIGKGIDGSAVLKGLKVAGARGLQTIPVEPKFYFMAPAIEEYLIREISPPNNKVGIGGRGVPDSQ